LLVGADMEPLLNNESLEQFSGYSPFICLSVLDWSCSALFENNSRRSFSPQYGMDGALRNEEQGNKDLAGATLCQQGKSLSLIHADSGMSLREPERGSFILMIACTILLVSY
jgi:hypothetical protein